MPPPSPESGASFDDIGHYLAKIGQYELLTAEDEIDLARCMEEGKQAEGLLSERMASEGQVDSDEIAKLESTAVAGQEARDLFTRSNLKLVVSIAKRYQGRGMGMLDLIQEGNLGLMHAVDKFDYRKGFKFSTYGTWWIRQAVQRAVAEKSRNIRLPSHAHDTLGIVNRAERDLRRQGLNPTIEEIAEEAGLSAEKVRFAKEDIPDTVSLFTQLSEDGQTLEEIVASDIDIAASAVYNVLAESGIKPLLDDLPERERYVIACRYGLGDGIPKTLDEISDELGVSRERVRQLERRAIIQMRHLTGQDNDLKDIA